MKSIIVWHEKPRCLFLNHKNVSIYYKWQLKLLNIWLVFLQITGLAKGVWCLKPIFYSYLLGIWCLETGNESKDSAATITCSTSWHLHLNGTDFKTLKGWVSVNQSKLCHSAIRRMFQHMTHAHLSLYRDATKQVADKLQHFCSASLGTLPSVCAYKLLSICYKTN